MKPLILVVDDDMKITTMLRRSLEYAGYRVREAHDGLDALEIAEAIKPDLVVLDIMMPVSTVWKSAAACAAPGRS